MYPINFQATPSDLSGRVVSVNDVQLQYAQIDNFVFGSGYADVDTNAPGAGAFRFDIPVASNFTSGNDAYLNGAAAVINGVHGFANSADDKILVLVTATGNHSNCIVTFSFSYEVK